MPAIDLSADVEHFVLPTEDAKPLDLLTDHSDWNLWPSDDEFSPLSSPSSGSSNSKRRSEDGELSSEDDSCRKRVKRSSSSSSSARSTRNHLRLPRPRDDFLDFRGRPKTAFVDKTRIPFQLPADNYRYLLLRPPRFGKTAFLSTLSQFYDVHGAGKFPEYFKTPEVAGNPLPGGCHHSQHLCLRFTFLNVRVDMDARAFANELKCDLFLGLNSFLDKYAMELGLSKPETYLTYGENESLKKVLALVKSHGRTLFVGVDSYDTPILESMLPRPTVLQSEETFVTPQDVMQLLDSYFWQPLRTGCDVIAKLFVTGTLALQTLVLRDLVDPAPNLQSCCGFTEDEALRFVQSIPHDIDVPEFRRQCGEYVFSAHDSISEPVLHPQMLIDRISEPSSQYSDSRAFYLTSSLLDLLPLESDVPNMVTLEGLVGLLATGVVEIEVELDTARDLDGTSVFWTALYHAGALTCVHDSNSTFRVANHKVLSLIHSRIDGLIYDRYRVFDDGRDQLDFLTALAQYDCEQHEPLLNVLSKVLRDQSLHSLGRVREPNLQGVLELIMRNVNLISCQFSELPEPIILLPADTTFVRVVGFNTNNIYHWRLTTLTLLGMWQGAYPNETEPSVDDLRELHETLCEEDEEKLLARPYRLWSDNQTATTVSVGSFFKAEAEYAQLIAVGGARILRRGGSAELSVLTSPEDEEEQYERAEDDYYIPDIIPDLYS